MKKNLLALIATVSATFILPSAFGQGALTPPGPPGPTMLTLSQIAPRTPISSLPFSITKPGAYYLTTNLTTSLSVNGVNIYTNDVTVDLNGFTISSVAPSATGFGILISPLGTAPLHNITILNGFIESGVTNNGSGTYTGNGFAQGIYCSGPSLNIRVSGVSVSGVLSYGIVLAYGTSTLVENCEVHTSGNYGIQASTVKSSMAVDIGGNAIIADEVLDCRGQSTFNGDGIFANEMVRNSYGFSTNGNNGIFCEGTVENCYGYSYGAGAGVDCYYNVINCFGYNAGTGEGVFCSTAESCYGYSTSGTAISSVNALNCSGVSELGPYAISTDIGENCFAEDNGSGYGVYASNAALNCYGYSSTGTGLYGYIANGCNGSTISATHNVNSY